MGIGMFVGYQSNWHFIKELSTPDTERICMTEEGFLILWYQGSLLGTLSLHEPIHSYLY